MVVRGALLLSLIVGALGTHDLSSTYPFRLDLHDNYTLYWTFDNVAQNITFAVRVRTTGWVGFGVSPNGQMPQSDVVIGWIDGTGNHFDDRFADTRTLPPVDSQQNWFLLRAEEEGGYTTLEFTRNYTSCDTRDRNIGHDTSYVVWSWNDQDPVNGVPSRHASQGSAVVNLLGGLVNQPQDPPDAQNFTIAVNNVEIPNVDTTYYCQGFLLPEEIRQQTRYITRFGISLSPESMQYVHHLLVHSCDTLDGVDLTRGAPCTSVDRRVDQCRGGPVVAAWAVGGREFVLPENVALPIGGPGTHRYLVIEMHYNNPRMVSGIRDSSGMVFTYSSQRRQHNGGVLQIGHYVSRSMVIPPHSLNYTLPSFCASSCTQQHLPQEGIKIFANTLHTHLAGIGVELSVLRLNQQCRTDRTEEVTFVDRNLNYDFNFQQTVHLPREITVLPGDTLLLNCFYRTINKTRVTLGGLATTDEMCLSYPIYYPRVNLTTCLSSPEFDKYQTFVRDHVPSNLQSEFSSLSPFDEEYESTLNKLEWTESQRNGLKEILYTSGQHGDICITNINSLSIVPPRQCLPEACCPYQEDNICSAGNGAACCERSCPAMRTPPLCAAASLASPQIMVLAILSIIGLLVAAF